MKRMIIVPLAVCGVLGVVGIASATSIGRAGGERATSARHARLAVFDRPFHASRAQLRERAEIHREFRRAPRGTAVASAAIDGSRPVAIDGTSAEAWIAPAADGGVCTFIPDPLGGYGSACASPDSIAAGHAMTTLIVGQGGPLAGQAIVVIVEPDAAHAPTVHRPDGTTTHLALANNVATGILQPGDQVSSGVSTIEIPRPVWDEPCGPGQSTATALRCG
jgi:hypothetical protein